MNYTNVSNEIENLKKSPLFNLSLTNKELFHSNFIAWFGSLYPELFIELMSTLLGDDKWAKGLDPKNIDIRREFKNFDISVFDDSKSAKPRLIVENKVKSVPTHEQLLEYQEKVANDKNVALLLLTMNEQLHTATSKENKTSWKLANYTDLSKCFEDLSKKIADPYHRLLVQDYCGYVSRLEMLINIFTSGESFLYNSSEYAIQKELGVHDVCGKRKIQYTYSQLVNSIELKNHKALENVHIAWAYTDAPLIELRFKTKSNVDEYILIQVQGRQYRHAVEFYDQNQQGYRIERVGNSYYPSPNGLSYIKGEYPNYLFGAASLANYPSFGKTKAFGQNSKNGQEGYCKFCNGKPAPHNGLYGCFVYQWIKLPEDITVSELVEALIEDAINISTLYVK